MGSSRRKDKNYGHAGVVRSAMGAFNTWAKGTILEKPENRKVAEVALPIMTEAAELNRPKFSTPLKMSQAENKYE